jgi:molecular chaperone GrpE (heat shock protein)
VRRPRLRIWILMTVVAIAALALTGWRRSQECSKIAARYDSRKRNELEQKEFNESDAAKIRAIIQVARDSVTRLSEPIPTTTAVNARNRSISDVRASDEHGEIARLETLLAEYEENLQKVEKEVEKYRKRAAFARATAAAYRRIARYPWLFAPPCEL